MSARRIRRRFGGKVRHYGARLAKNRRGVTIIEFAIVAPLLIGLLLAILYTATAFLAQQMLQTAAQSAGRLLLTGGAQTMTMSNGDVGMTASDLKNVICNGATVTNSSGQTVVIPKMLPPMLSCSQLTVNVATASAYNVARNTPPTFTYSNTGAVTSTNTGYSTTANGGGQNVIVVLQLIYLWPTSTGPLGLTLVNQPNSNRMLVATSLFTTEAYSCSSSQTSC